MHVKKTVFLATLLVTLLFAGQALAAAIGFRFEMSGDTNTPTVTLQSYCTTHLLSDFVMTIGDEAYNYDFVNNVQAGGVGYALITPDTVNDGTRSNSIVFSFTGFGLGNIFQFETDVDIDNSNTIENYRRVLFNNGAADNCVLTVTFSNSFNSVVMSATLPDYLDTEPVVYDTFNPPGTPLPGSVMLLAGGLLSLIGFRRLTS